jgi:RHS repeat-associated protein
MCLVDAASGRLTLTEVDFEVRGVMPIVLERSYRSTNIWQSDVGQGWGHTFCVQLWPDEPGGLTFRGTDGRRIPLPLPGEGKPALNSLERVAISHVRPDDIVWPALAGLTAGIYAVSTEGSLTLLFDARPAPGFPLRGFADRNGNLAVIESGAGGLPGRLSDPHGRQFEFARDPRGLLTKVTLRSSSGGTSIVLVEYAHDEAGNLVAVRDGAGVRRYAYDGAHRLISHRDRMGKDCLSEFDTSGRCTFTTGPGGVRRRSYDYDPASKRTTVSDSLGHATVIEYDDRERVVRTIDREGGVSIFTYDGEGRLVEATDQLGHASAVLFDSVGAPAGKVRADGSSVAIVAGENGEVARMVTSTGAVETYERDERGRVVAVTKIGRGRTEVGYDAAGNIERVKTPFGKDVRLAWSSDRRRVVESDAIGVLTDQELDEFGRVVSVRDAFGATTEYEYHATGEIARISHSDGTSRTFNRDSEGRLLAWTAEDGATTRWAYDSAGRCVEIVLPDGGIVRSEYDLENRLIAVVDAGGRRHEFSYSPEGLVADARFPDGRLLSYQHDPVGRIVGMIHPDGTATAARRDNRGRLEATRYPDGSVKTATHDEESRWTRVELGGHEIARTLTPEGQAVEESQGDFRFTREFGEAGQLLTVTGNDGRRVRYGYDEDGRIVEIEIADGRWVDEVWELVGQARSHRLEYDRKGHLRRWVAPSGVTETRSYDVRGRLVEQTVAAGEQVVVQRRYAYDAVGRVIAIQDSRRGQRRFAYDVMGRLTAAGDSRGTRRFSWGRSGERTSDVQYGSAFRVFQAGGRQYSYDERGFVVQRDARTGPQDLAWTPRGLLASASLPDGRDVRFEYDPHDRLITREASGQITRYIWNDESLWGITTDGQPPVAFAGIPGAHAPLEQSIGERACSVHVDQIGTVQELVDEHGNVVWQNPAGFWGEFDDHAADTTTEDCPLGFPGQIRDDLTGLYYNRYRFYDPVIGRYLTPDPVGIFGGLDPYGYVQDPVNLYDPTGLACRGKNDDPTLYRGDSRPPSDICANGFPPSNPTANISVLTHVNGVPTTGSNWVSTSYEGSTAERFAHSAANQYGGQPLVYVIDNPGCGVEVDCDPDVQAWEASVGGSSSEQEIAFNGGLPASRVVGYYHADDPTSFQACP